MHDQPTIERALVLGGGGSAGNAWLIGVLAGLHEAGLGVGNADRIIGTSAGATAAIQISNAPLGDLYTAILTTAPPSRPETSGGLRPAVTTQRDHLQRTQQIIDTSSSADEMRQRMGRLFIELDDATAGTGTERWRSTVATRLRGCTWPTAQVLLTAVNADTGEGTVFDRHSDVDLIDAVAASTSGGSAYRIGDRRYFDGGYRRNENADLASGAARVLVLSPFGGRSRQPPAWRMQLEAQVDDLRATGSRVDVVSPDEASVAAFGGNMMDLARRPPSARAGFAQGRVLAPRISEFWRD